MSKSAKTPSRLKDPATWIVFVITAIGVIAHVSGVSVNVQKWLLTASTMLGIFGGLFFPAVFAARAVPPVAHAVPPPLPPPPADKP